MWIKYYQNPITRIFFLIFKLRIRIRKVVLMSIVTNQEVWKVFELFHQETGVISYRAVINPKPIVINNGLSFLKYTLILDVSKALELYIHS